MDTTAPSPPPTEPVRSRPLRDVGAEPPATRPSVVDVLPQGPTGYHHFLRTERRGWWRGALAVLLTAVLFLLLQVVVAIPLYVLQALTGWELMRVDGAAVVMTPALLLATNVSIGLMIPVSMLLQRMLFGQRRRWLHSVHGRFRWGLSLRLAAVLVPVWLVYAAVLTWFFPAAAGVGGAAPTPTSTLTMLVVVVLTTPFQAAGEEYAARGLLARAFGSWFASPRVALVAALVGPNLIFMVAHGAGDWTLALYYLAFGVACSLITWRTGGLEAAVVLHAVNNTVIFGLSAFLTSEVVIDRSAGSGGAMVLVPGAMMALVTMAIWVWSRRRDVPRAADPRPLA